MLPGWSYVHNITDDRVGRVIVAWNVGFCSVIAKYIFKQHVLVEMSMLNGSKFLLPVVYGSNNYVERRELWCSLMEFQEQILPWVLAGDFNIIREESHSMGVLLPPAIAMREFNECLEGIGVVELSSHGCLFTWSCHTGEGCLRRM
ncbi:hypothetical protein LIER_25638 [Lithospermum erythrorhizon]|uniref:Endonuclease/exonuclease/phosphatase domain-containing protein n=1 Tax=Lithospermum erythrorhizon TaxID=34254 RepID=A0AAV3R7K9_LITER